MYEPLVPEFLRSYRLKCKNCAAEHTFAPGFWLERFDSENVPEIEWPQGMESAQEQMMRPMVLRCMNCDTKMPLVPNPKISKGNVDLFGDEAELRVDGEHSFMYALVGAPERMLPEICDQLAQLKRSVEPGRDPATWRIHMKDIHSGDNRKRHPIFSSWNRQNCEQISQGMAQLIKEQEALLVYAITALESPGKHAKKQAFQALFVSVVKLVSDTGYRLRLRFDADGKRRTGRMQGWAEELYEEARTRRMYSFLSSGLRVAVPELVEPGSHSCSELADFVAFALRRYHLERAQGNENYTYPLEDLGRAFWAHLGASRNLHVRPSVGYPF